ncbi:MAG: hypothetical protein CM1200mP41_37440 [Gammaproteobacteria bacterium]|nr:MAG: hypothetical protein CM1200mP41_37440 [Gammaproteobacteria bacterium]
MGPTKEKEGIRHAVHTQPDTGNVDSWRNPESVHRGAFALVDDSGKTRLAVGDVLRPIYPRSALSRCGPFPLVESGAADHWHLGDAELAVACGSHGGESATSR